MKLLCNRAVLLIGVLVLLGLGAMAVPVLALEVPALSGRVNDSAHILSSGSVQVIEQALRTLEREESTQVAVLTIPSLKGENLEQYSLKVAETWKIGQQGTDNGALLLIAVNDRKIRIETGYGLEGSLTDLVAGRIIRERIVPAFRRGDYDQGVIDGVGAMIAAVKGDYAGLGAGGATTTKSRPDPMSLLVFLGFGLVVIGNIFRRRKVLAAIVGGLYAPFTGLLFPFMTGWLLFVLLIPVGVIGALVISTLAGTGVGRRGGSSGFFPGGGGFSGSGFGGGGFSGGGGGFGGGGASGGW
jgi:uncharacterized protein